MTPVKALEVIFVENPAKLGQFEIFMYVDLYLCKGTSALNNAEQFKSLINQLPITDLIKSAVKTFTILLIKLNIIVAE